MKDKPRIRILLYSDYGAFAGSENMPANLLNSPVIRRDFDLLFAYRYSAKYAAGMAARVSPEARTIPLRIPAAEALLEALDLRGLNFFSLLLRRTGIFLLLRYLFALYAAGGLYFLFRKVRPDILHVNDGGYPGAYSCISAVFAARAAGVKRVFFVVNNIAVPYLRFTRRLEKPIDGFVGRNVSFFVTGSKYAGERLREVLSLPAGKVRNIPNGIADREAVESLEAVRKRLDVTGDCVVLGTVADLEPRKGHKYLLEAMALLRSGYADFQKVILLIEGVGGERERLEKLAAELALDGNVRFLGRESHIFDLIRAFDVFILPSVGYEDFPNVILEAMSMGKPVIGTRVAGIPEQVADGDTGLVVEPADARQLASAIVRLLRNSEERKDMGRKGRERFNALFSCDRAISNYSALYSELAG